MVRILFKHGLSKLAIAHSLRRSFGTVTSIVDGTNITAAGDEGDDWEFVDDAFKKRYPPMKPEDTQPKTQCHQSANRSIPAPVIQKTGMAPALVSQPVAFSTTQIITSRDANASCPSSSWNDQTRHGALRRTGTSIQRAICIDADSTPEPEVVEVSPPLPKLRQFLANLEHDLSGILVALNEQDLGTSEKLFALAAWPDDELHSLFKEALPQLTVAQRFMLVKGMKKTVG